ncbi:MAG: hypothetical protein E7593_05930 [Ruminococcaceae bacterium]|nr:hypothetical protein [Oscillospiraceae bacterium]MBE6671723.1 hypothetical protein [Oscillospiraceae bacterium]
MRRFFRNIPWRNVLIITLTVVLGIGAIAGIASIANKDTKTISATHFKRGAIDSNGFYIESDTSIYTKDLIECQGLEIAPDFESTGTYQVFYYSPDKSFIGATEVLECHNNVLYTKGKTFTLAKYCRIMITPDVPKDDYGNTIEDYKIKFYEVAGIANNFTITVDKKQNFSVKKAIDGLENKANILGEGVWDRATNSFLGQSSQMYIFDKIDVGGANNIVLKVATSTLSNSITYSDGQVFTFPLLYEGDDTKLIATGTESKNVIHYNILESNSEYTYISYDVSAYTSICGAVDIDSSDILEIYVIK